MHAETMTRLERMTNALEDMANVLRTYIPANATTEYDFCAGQLAEACERLGESIVNLEERET